MVAAKSFRGVQARSLVIALAILAVLALGALGLAAVSGAQTGSAAQTPSPKAFAYGPADAHQEPAPPERTESQGPR
jgi:hypothetical protein